MDMRNLRQGSAGGTLYSAARGLSNRGAPAAGDCKGSVSSRGTQDVARNQALRCRPPGGTVLAPLALTAPFLAQLVLSSGQTAPEELPALRMEAVELELPGGGRRQAERGRLCVPVVRKDASSAPIEVDVWRFPAAEGVPPGRLPIFLLHGGPGWPGWEPAQIAWERDVAPYVAHGDLVVVGQRGIGSSHPNTACDEFAVELDPDLTRDERAAGLREQLEACRNHWEVDYDLSGFNVIEAAGDVDDVRRLLGYEQIVVWGGSFGSHWGMAVMRFHPEIVARAVLHGMEGPDHTYDSPGGLLAALGRVAAEAEASPELAGRLPQEGLIEALRSAIRRVEQEPARVQVDGRAVVVDADALRGQAMGYTSSVASRRAVAGWPADVMRLFEGDYAAVARAIDRGRREAEGLPTASFFLLDCASGITPERRERYQSDPAIEIVGDPSWYYDVACPVWEVDLGDGFRTGFQTSIPTLVVHGTWDTSTPFENALELAPCFEDLHLITVEGGTHGALREAMEHDPTFAAAVMEFAATGATAGLPERIELPPIAWSAAW
jgi:pimeloyl-ACP methyl ester carboxylesterase